MPTLPSEPQAQTLIPSYGIYKAIEMANANILRLATFYESPLFDLAKKQADMAQIFTKSLTASFFPKTLFDSLNELPRTINLAMGFLPPPVVNPPTHIPTVLPLPEAKTKTPAVSKPQVVIPINSNQNTPVFGLSLIEGGSFKYRRKILKGICMKNQTGRLLSLFIDSHNRFASDQDIQKALPTQDGFYIGQVIHRLKQAFKQNGFIAVIERRDNPDGYILIEIASCKKRG